MSLFKLFGNVKISLKPVIVIFTFGLVLAIITITVNRSLQSLLLQASRQQVEQEAQVTQSRFARAGQIMLGNTKTLANMPDLIEAIVNGDEHSLKTIVLPGAAEFNFDDIDIVDTTGDSLLDSDKITGPQEATLLSLALQGSESSGLTVEQADGELKFRLTTVIPLRDRSNEIIGGLISSREINETFLEEINLACEHIELVFIHEGQLGSIVEDSGRPFSAAVQAVLLDQTAINQALNGQAIIVNDLVSEVGIPYAIAHMPLAVGDRPEAVVAILAHQEALGAFEKQLASKVTFTILLLGLAALVGVAVFARQNVIIPIQKLQRAARRMIGGDYSQRVEMTSLDEIGQLGQSFNMMVEVIQERESELQEFAASLEQQVTQRTAELSDKAAALRKSEERFRQVVNSISDHIYMTEFTADGEQINHYLSPHIETLTGYPQEKFNADWDFWPSIIIHPDDRVTAAAQATRFAQGQSSEVEYRLVRADGDVIWVRDRGRVTKDPLSQNIFVYGIVGDITQHHQAEEALKLSHQELQQSNKRLETIYKIGQLITSQLNLEDVLNTVARNTAELLGTDTSAIFLLDEAGQTLTIQGAYGLSEHVVKNTRDRLGESIAGRVALTGKPIVANDLPNHPQFYNSSAAKEGLLACISVPIRAGDKIIGTLDIHSKTDRYDLGEEQVYLMSLLADQAVIAIENARLYESVRESEASLAEAQQVAHLGNWSWDLQSHMMQGSDELHRIFDRSPQELEKVTYEVYLNEIIHPDDRERVIKLFSQIVSQKQLPDHEYRIRQPNGQVRMIHIWGNLVCDEQNKPVRMVGVMQDITERKQAEEALRESEEHFRTVAETAGDAIISIDSRGQLILWNRSAENMFGYSAAEMMGQPLSLIMPAQFREAHENGIKRVAATKKSTLAGKTVELVGLRKDGHELPIELSLAAWQRGEELFFTGIIRDITERKQVEAILIEARDQATEASHLKSQLLASISHDLRTPLSAIIGYTDMLQSGFYGSITERQHEATAEIIDSANQMLDFINNLVNQARLESGQVILNIAPFAPVELLGVIQSTAKSLAQFKGLEVIVEIEPNVPTTMPGDFYWLRQILVNLVGNAIKFTEQGEIRVSICQADENHWSMQVSDTGAGISEEDQSYIFDTFRQVGGDTIAQKQAGFGLGLSIVHRLTVLMDGQITLTSQVGQGSTFTVILPLIKITEEIS